MLREARKILTNGYVDMEKGEKRNVVKIHKNHCNRSGKVIE